MSKKEVEVKIVELSGQKLDPNAKYLLLFDIRLNTTERIRALAENLERLVGRNFVIGGTVGNPSESVKVYEFAPKATRVSKATDAQANTNLAKPKASKREESK